MPRKDKTIDPIDDTFDNVANSIVQVATHKPPKINKMARFSSHQVAGPQIPLDLGIEVQRDADLVLSEAAVCLRQNQSSSPPSAG